MPELPGADALLLTAVLTTAGTVAFAPLITGFIAVLKGLIPGIDGQEPRVAALAALIIVVLALVDVVSKGAELSLQLLFTGFTAWYALARLSMGIHDDISGSSRSLTRGLTTSNYQPDDGGQG